MSRNKKRSVFYLYWIILLSVLQLELASSLPTNNDESLNGKHLYVLPLSIRVKSFFFIENLFFPPNNNRTSIQIYPLLVVKRNSSGHIDRLDGVMPLALHWIAANFNFTYMKVSI